MANEDYFSQDLNDFNPYYAPYYDDQNKNNKNSKNKKSKNEQKNSEGKGLLRRAEDKSLIGKNPDQQNSGWTNNVAGKAPVIPGPKGAKLSLNKPRKGITVVLIILFFLVGGGFFLGSSNILLPGALNSLFTSATNSNHASYTLRSVKLTSYMLKNLDNTVTTGFTGLARYKHMSSSFKTRLANNNIVVDGSGRNTVLKWTKTNAHGSETITIGADAFQSEYLNNDAFRADYDSARRGRVATFFDNVADKVYNKFFNVTRNNPVEKTGNAETDAENYRKSVSDQVNNNSTDFTNSNRTYTGEYEYELNGEGELVIKKDANGNPIRATKVESDNVASSKTDNSIDAETQTRGYVANIANTLAVGANGICSLMKIGHAISVTISTLEKYAAVQVYLRPMESVSRTMAGTDSYVNEFLNNFTTKAEAEVELYNEGIQVSGIDFSDPSKSSNNATSSVARKKVTGAPIQAQGVQAILGNNYNVSNGITNYSSERISSTISKTLQMSPEAMKNCIYIQAGAAVVSFAVTLASLGTKVVVDFAWSFIKGAIVGVAAAAIVNFAIPTLANYLFRNVFESVVGIPAGELFASGAADANFENGIKGSGQIGTTQENVLQYSQSVQQVADLDARVDRITRSPLDITSPNTFLGSIAYNTILPIATSSNGIISTIGTIFRTTSSSLSNIVGAAHATGKDSSFMTTFGNEKGACPQADAQGYACDMYGHIIPVTPLLNIEPDDPRYVKFINENIDSDTGEVIEGSYLAKFTVAHMTRQALQNVVDTNVYNEFEINNPILNAAPFLGDILDLINAGIDLENYNWATDVYSNDIPANDKYREEAQLASVVTADFRALDMLSSDSLTEAAYQNPITAYINKYEAEHPITDNSYAGYIARITGLPKETAEIVIAAAEYYEFLNNYDPSTRIAMTEENTTVQPAETIIARFDDSKLDFSSKSESETNEEIFLAKQSEQYIIYADIRNRSFAA